MTAINKESLTLEREEPLTGSRRFQPPPAERSGCGRYRQANAALYRTVIVRMHHHEPTRTYLTRWMSEGKTKLEIIRCLKRYLVREIWALLHPDQHPWQDLQAA